MLEIQTKETMTKAAETPITITLDLSFHEAAALAQFLKRSTYGDYRARAVDDEDAYVMQGAARKVRESLAEAGFDPR